MFSGRFKDNSATFNDTRQIQEHFARFENVLTRQEVVLGVQQGGDGFHPGHLDAGGGRLQCEALRRATRPQHEFTGITVHTVLHRQVTHLITHKNNIITPSINQSNTDPCLQPVSSVWPWCCSWTGIPDCWSLYAAVRWKWWSARTGKLCALYCETELLHPAPKRRRSPAAAASPETSTSPGQQEDRWVSELCFIWPLFFVSLYKALCHVVLKLHYLFFGHLGAAELHNRLKTFTL